MNPERRSVGLPSMLIGTALAAACGPGALAQSSNDVLPLPQSNRFISFEQPNLWTTRAQITITYYSDTAAVRREGEANDVYFETWDHEEMAVIFPVIVTTASATQTLPGVRGELYLDSRLRDDEAVLVGPYQSQAIYARWDGGAGRGTQAVRLVQSQDLVCYETIYHEQEALTVGWPAGSWPPDADSTFQPQQFVSNVRSDQLTQTPVTDLLARWTEGKDPKGIKPAYLAKYLAGRVQEHVRTVLPPNTSRRDTTDLGQGRVVSSALAGFNIQTADETALSGEGTLHDMTILLAALYRAAGLPARIVIGIDETERSRFKEVRSWVEFALFDEGDPKTAADDVLAWIPVDIGRLRERSNRAYPLDRPWEFFGTHDELDDIAPLGLHFHPPTAVVSYRPALFGWSLTPSTPQFANQFIDFDVSRTPNTPEWRRENDRRRNSRP